MAVGAGVTLTRPGPRSQWSVAAPGSTAPAISISCVAATVCMALGGSPNEGNAGFEEWNGRSWVALPSPPTGQASGAFTGPTDISCTSPRFCAAVGGFTLVDSLEQVAVVETWNGQAWATPDTPVSTAEAGGTISLTDISCVTPTFCMAVGGEPGAPHEGARSPKSGMGAKWSAVPTPSEQGSANLDTVSCTSTDFCLAEGVTEIDTASTVETEPISDTWNGSSWAQTSAPLPMPQDLAGLSQLALSCGSATQCVSVWSSRCPVIRFGGPTGCSMTEGTPALSQMWNGSTWRLVPIPNPSPSSGNSNLVSDIACATGDDCVAVGIAALTATVNGSVVAGIDRVGLIESWDGSRWTAELEPSSN